MNLRRRLIPQTNQRGTVLTTPNRKSTKQSGTLTALGLICCVFLVSTVVWRTWSKSSSSPLLRRVVLAKSVITPTPPSANGVYDCIIVGTGPAGLSAALFAARSSLSVLVLGSTAGGLLSEAIGLENYPSWNQPGKKSAATWLSVTQQQAQQFGATFLPGAIQVTSIQFHHHPFIVTLDAPYQNITQFKAYSIILATGATPRRLQLPGEEHLWGNYIHVCALCDANLYTDQDTVMVVGGGDAAVQAALYMARTVRKVYVVHRKEDWSRPQNRRAVTAMQHTENIELITPYTVSSWVTQTDRLGTVTLVGATLQHANDPKQERSVEIQGAFLMIGAIPNTNWMNDIVKTPEGFIKLQPRGSAQQATSVLGVFAAGEVADPDGYRQAITAAAQGAQAAIDAERWLGQYQFGSTGNNRKTSHQSAEVIHPLALLADGEAESHTEEHVVVKQPLDDDCDLEMKDCIRALVERYPVVVFSKPWCHFCQKAIETLTVEGVRSSTVMRVVDLTKYDNGAAIQRTLQVLTGRRTVPNVFVGGTSIGGGDETVSLHKQGKLKGILEAAKAII